MCIESEYNCLCKICLALLNSIFKGLNNKYTHTQLCLQSSELNDISHNALCALWLVDVAVTSAYRWLVYSAVTSQRSEKTNRTSHRGVSEFCLNYREVVNGALSQFRFHTNVEGTDTRLTWSLHNCRSFPKKLRPNFVLSDLQRVSDTAHCAPLLCLNKSASAWAAFISSLFHSDSVYIFYMLTIGRNSCAYAFRFLKVIDSCWSEKWLKTVYSNLVMLEMTSYALNSSCLRSVTFLFLLLNIYLFSMLFTRSSVYILT